MKKQLRGISLIMYLFYLNLNLLLAQTTICSGTAFTSTLTNRALNFDGTNDYVDCGTNSSLNITSSMTVELWIKPTVNLGNGKWDRLVHRNWTTGYFFGGRSGATNALAVAMAGDLSACLTPNNTVSVGVWQHVAFVFDDPGNTIKIYKNGALITTSTFNGTMAGGTSNLYLSESSEPFGGSMTEVRIWNCTRTQTEIQNNMNCTLVGDESGFKAYYKFNHGTANGTNTGVTTATDVTSNANNGTLNNFALTGTTSNWVDGAGTTYTWTVVDNPNVTGESNQASPQSNVSQTLTNTSNSTQAVVYTCTPSLGAVYTLTINVLVAPVTTASTAGTRGTTAKASIQATSNVGSISWYAASSGGSSLGTSNSGVNWTTPSISSTTTYYAEVVNGSCVSASRTPVSATVSDALVIIGKENSSSLLQKQSNDTSDSLRVFVSTYAASNAANNGSITNDVSFIAIANNGGKLNATTASNTEKPSGIYSRLEREWQVTNINFSNDFSLEIKWLVSSNVTLSDLRLLVDSDGDFSNATTYSAADGLTFEIGSIIVRGIKTTMIPSGSTRYITIGSISSSTPLPVQFISFNAKPKNNVVELNWQTATETNNDYFAIERSIDGVSWISIDTVNGVGTTNAISKYVHTDENPLSGTSYYRLKQVDFNQDFSYSNIAVVNFEGIKIVDLFPNPSEGSFNLAIKSSLETTIDINVYNAIGQIVKTQQVQIIKGANTVHTQFEGATGKYLVTVKSTDGQYYDYTVILNK